MEVVLKVYRRPYDAQFPVVCMDEMPKQLLGEAQAALPMKAGQAKRVDSEYERKGTCTVWMFVEPLGKWRRTNATSRRTGVDWAHQIKELVDDPRYASTTRITLVCDNLSTHSLSSLYATFEPDEASRIADRIEIVHTPKHGSWLNIAEIEFSVLSRQCTKDRIKTEAEVDKAVKAWCKSRNKTQVGVNWQFTTEDARVKLCNLYPIITTEEQTLTI
jgi:hypothetical protein